MCGDGRLPFVRISSQAPAQRLANRQAGAFDSNQRAEASMECVVVFGRDVAERGVACGDLFGALGRHRLRFGKSLGLRRRPLRARADEVELEAVPDRRGEQHHRHGQGDSVTTDSILDRHSRREETPDEDRGSKRDRQQQDIHPVHRSSNKTAMESARRRLFVHRVPIRNESLGRSWRDDVAQAQRGRVNRETKPPPRMETFILKPIRRCSGKTAGGLSATDGLRRRCT